MADQNPTGDRDTAASTPTGVEDDRDQAAVLTVVLALHPDHLTIDDLVREVSGGAADFDETDRVERAVRDLVGAGLLHNLSGLVAPSRAALRFDQLTER